MSPIPPPIHIGKTSVLARYYSDIVDIIFTQSQPLKIAAVIGHITIEMIRSIMTYTEDPTEEEKSVIMQLISSFAPAEYLHEIFDIYQGFVIARNSQQKIVFFQAASISHQVTPFSSRTIPVIHFGPTARIGKDHYSRRAFFYYYNIKVGRIKKHFIHHVVISKQFNPNITEHIPRLFYKIYSDFHQNLNPKLNAFLNKYFNQPINRGLYTIESLKGFEITFPEAIKFIPKNKKLLFYFTQHIYHFEKNKLVCNGHLQITISHHNPLDVVRRLLTFQF